MGRRLYVAPISRTTLPILSRQSPQGRHWVDDCDAELRRQNSVTTAARKRQVAIVQILVAATTLGLCQICNAVVTVARWDCPGDRLPLP